MHHRSRIWSKPQHSHHMGENLPKGWRPWYPQKRAAPRKWNWELQGAVWNSKKVSHILRTGGRQEKIAFIKLHAHEHSITLMCEVLEIHRSKYYKYVSFKDLDYKDYTLMKATFERHKKTLGYQWLKIELRRLHGWFINPKKVLRIMRKFGLRAKYIRDFRFKKIASGSPIKSVSETTWTLWLIPWKRRLNLPKKKIWMDSHLTQIKAFSIFQQNISKPVDCMVWSSYIQEKPTISITLSLKVSTLYQRRKPSIIIISLLLNPIPNTFTNGYTFTTYLDPNHWKSRRFFNCLLLGV